MSHATPAFDSHGARREPSVADLAGKVGWVITDGKTGMDVQARGVADALGLAITMKQVPARGLFAALAPWGPVAPGVGFGRLNTLFSPPWPVIAIATGRLSIPYLRALRKASPPTFTVILQDPKTGPASADLVWVPQHDRLRGANVVTTLTSPHSFSPARLAQLRSTTPPAIAAIPHPRIAVILGGPNAVYRYTPEDTTRLAASLRSLSGLGVSFMITPSRRSEPSLIAAVAAATSQSPRLIWDQTGPNPYPDYLAHADALIVTADSVNMCGEACATGRPVFVFHPSGGSAKFTRFHEGLVNAGTTRALPAQFGEVPSWSYAPLDSAATIATEINRHWQRWRDQRADSNR